MGLRFVQTYTENGDILDGLGWVLDNAELAGEVNGSMDRDNLPASTISRSEIVNGAFTDTLYLASSSVFTPDETTTQWQNGGSGTGIVRTTLTAEEDCVVTVELFVGWTWASNAVSYDTADTSCNTIQIRMSIDGQVFALSERHDDTRWSDHVTLVGIAVVNAGNHSLIAECRVVRVTCNDEQEVDVVTEGLTIPYRGILVTEEKR